MPFRRSLALVFAALAISASSAAAQPLGTFRWQLMPHCNVITVTVTQQGGVYILSGTDDRCGAGNQQGSAAGTAFLTPSGLVGIGLTTVVPGGTPVHTEASLSISSLNGTWRDSAGNSGTFAFRSGGPIPGGVPRPIPAGGIAPASITNVQIASNAVTGTNIVDASITTVDIADAARSTFAGGGNQFVSLPAFGTTPAVIRTVTLQAPAPGKALVNVSGFFEFGSTSPDNGRCEISTTATLINNDMAFYASEGAAATNHALFVPFSSVRGFEVPAATTSFHLICDRVNGIVAVWRSFMTAIYTAQ